MKKLLISLAALAAISTAALAAGNHSWDNRDVQGMDSSGAEPGSSYNYYQPALKRHRTVLEAEPLAIPSGAGEPSVSALSPYGDQGLSNFQKMQLRSEQRDQGDR